jgi:hypothetical protein
MRKLTPDTFDGTDFPEFDDGFSKSMIDRDVAGQSSDHKRLGRNHCIRQKRRKVPRASHPGCGIGARGIRNRASSQ